VSKTQNSFFKHYSQDTFWWSLS